MTVPAVGGDSVADDVLPQAQGLCCEPTLPQIGDRVASHTTLAPHTFEPPNADIAWSDCWRLHANWVE